MRLTAIQFFGDIKELAPAAKADSAHSAFEELMRLLGGVVATEEENRKRFNMRFISLGARVDWCKVLDNEVIAENEPGRLLVVSDLSKQFLSQDPIRSPLLLSMRETVLVDNGHLFNKFSAVACNPIAQVVRDSSAVLPRADLIVYPVLVFRVNLPDI